MATTAYGEKDIVRYYSTQQYYRGKGGKGGKGSGYYGGKGSKGGSEYYYYSPSGYYEGKGSNGSGGFYYGGDHPSPHLYPGYGPPGSGSKGSNGGYYVVGCEIACDYYPEGAPICYEVCPIPGGKGGKGSGYYGAKGSKVGY